MSRLDEPRRGHLAANLITALITAIITLMMMLWALQIASDPTVTLPPCPTEDSTNDCYWDATTHGNGIGRSFYVQGGEVHYLP